MASIVAYLVFALCFCAGIGACVYLVIHGHPWFAFFVLVVTARLSVSHAKK